MSDQISWVLELGVLPGHLEDLRELTAEMVEAAGAEPGTLIYERYISEDEKTVWVCERYTDAAAAVAHLTRFVKTFGDRLGQTIVRKRPTVFGSPSEELKAILDRFDAEYVARLAGFSRC